MTEKIPVLITRKLPGLGILEASKGFDLQIHSGSGPMDPDELAQKLVGKKALISTVVDHLESELIAQFPDLEIISQFGVGYNNIDIIAAQKNQIVVTNTPGVLTEATCDLTISLILNITRNIGVALDHVKHGEWSAWDPYGFLGPTLKGKVLGIVGLGKIGQAVAFKMSRAFDMKIIYHNRSQFDPSSLAFEAKQVDFDTLLHTSDIISVHCDYNQDSKGLFNLSTFLKMKPYSYFINTSRGGIHDEDALFEVLSQQKIAGAAVDVSSPEPMRKNHPLLSLTNFMITPHIGSATWDAREKMGQLASENLIHYFGGHHEKLYRVV